MSNRLTPASAPIARTAREQFVAHLEAMLPGLSDQVRTRLIELTDAATNMREMQDRRDMMLEFEQQRGKWVQNTQSALRRALVPPTATARVRMDLMNLSLIGDDVVENKILASRLALAVGEKAQWDLNELKVRIQHLEGDDDFQAEDVLRPEAVAQLLLEQWTGSGLKREAWTLLKDLLHEQIIQRMVAGYKKVNEYLVSQGVLRDIDLSGRVKRPPAASPRRPGQTPAANAGDGAAQASAPAPLGADSGPGGAGGGAWGGGAQGGGWGGWGGRGVGGDFGHGGGAGGAGGGFGHTGPGGASTGGYGAPSTGGYGGQHAGGPAGGAPGYGGGAHGGGGYAGGGYGGQGGQGGPGGNGAGAAGGPAGGGYAGGAGAAGYAGSDFGAGGQAGGAYGGGAGGYSGGQAGAQANGYGAGAAGGYAGGAGGGYAGGGHPGNGHPGSGHPGSGSAGGPGAAGAAGGASGPGSAPGAMQGGVQDETRLMTHSTPLARARARASGVLGQLKRLLNDKAGVDTQHGGQPSPQLAAAMSQHAAQVVTQVQTQVHTRSSEGGEIVVFDDSDVQEMAVSLRNRTSELKKKASTQSEKAIIEIVALMFQSILAEERIPPAVRVWFARLQMPVLRVAIAEPEFFGSLEHPARQLIDRMGACVLGFDAAEISGSALEIEIKRVVQVIEQYPETGRRVFQLVYDEFQKFLSRFLTEDGPTSRLVSIAQQVEQKETLAIQYTIELRKMLSDVPVRDEIREYLFKVWAEVLAVAAVKHGPQHGETSELKKCASDLVWAASAKPNRQERARVIQDLPRLLQKLRQGMTLLGLQAPVQEEHIKLIGDTLADAFLSKTEAIPQARIEEMAKRLANLEDYVSDEADSDLPLDKESIELMLGIDASMIEVIADGGSMPNAAMLGWAQELQQGHWFTLDHNGRPNEVQYVWRSDRRQLHLFASRDGRSFLVQLRRLASYLQAGLLVPKEEEALTVRATREALAKLDANPERLFQ